VYIRAQWGNQEEAAQRNGDTQVAVQVVVSQGIAAYSNRPMKLHLSMAWERSVPAAQTALE
jgi:hypothetical protein